MEPLNASREVSPEDIGWLYDQYAPAILGFIISLVGDRAKAEEILPEIFCEISIKISTYKHKDKLLLWLLNLSRNHCVSKLLEDNKKTKSAFANEFADTLPLPEKTVFALVYLKGLTISEVADLLHLPLSKVDGIFAGLPKFSHYVFQDFKRTRSPVGDMLQSLMHNMIPENDQARLAALRKYEILYTAPEEPFDKITQTVARVLDMPMCFLSLVDEDTVFFKSQAGPFGKTQVNRESSLCSLTVLSREPLVIEDASLETCFKNNPYVQAQNGIRFYAGSPLISADGYLIGALCVVDTKHRTFSFNDTLLLTEFAEIAMREVESRHNSFQELLFHEQVSLAKMQQPAG